MQTFSGTKKVMEVQVKADDDELILAQKGRKQRHARGIKWK